MNTIEVHLYINHLYQPKTINSYMIYPHHIISAYHDLSIRDFSTLFSCDLRGLNYSRNTLAILSYISTHKRCLQTRIALTTGMGQVTVANSLNHLIELGLLAKRPIKVRKNIPGLVPHTSYYITDKGKKVLSNLNDLLQQKASKPPK